MGEFFLMRGTADGFGKAERLRGTDGKLLAIQPRNGSDAVEDGSDRMCTRPTALDFNGDGHLDIVSGNEGGRFALFLGGADGFAPESSWLTGPRGAMLKVAGHSDPHFADWDADGDLDLLSGSLTGEVSWFPNIGSDAEPQFGKARRLLAPPEVLSKADIVLGDDHITRPQKATRVTAADVDGDGKLDLLVGDAVEITTPAEGVSEDECRRRLAEWRVTLRGIVSEQPKMEDYGNKNGEHKAAMDAFYARRNAHWDKRPAIINRHSTGYVWLFRRK